MASLNLIEACDRAAGIISQAQGIDTLYHKALRCFGEGRLRCDVMSLATEAIQDEKLSREVFMDNESITSFLCGIWIQFLLVEVAGVKKEKLKALARRAFESAMDEKLVH